MNSTALIKTFLDEVQGPYGDLPDIQDLDPVVFLASLPIIASGIYSPVQFSQCQPPVYSRDEAV